jgi:hypothetical protein
MGFGGPGWARAERVRAERVGPSGSARSSKRVLLLLFSEIISSAKTITVKSSECLQGTKNTQKITKIPGKFLEID